MTIRSGNRRRRGFTLIELLVVMTIIAILVGMLIPAIGGAIATARTTACLNKMKGLGTAVGVFKSTTGSYPLASTANAPLLGSDAPAPGAYVAGDPAKSAGFSWCVQLLSYLDKKTLSEKISSTSARFSKGAFDPQIANSGGIHYSRSVVEVFRCPDSSGGERVEAGGPAAYQTGWQNQQEAAALGNYVAIAGAYLDSTGQALVENGVIVSRSESRRKKGLLNNKVTDRTLMLTESNENKVACWYDGQAMWVTALRIDSSPNAPAGVPVKAQGTGHTALLADRDPNDGEPAAPADSTALNFGPSAAKPDNLYLKGIAPFSNAQNQRAWGPSSKHAGGIIVHVWASGAAVRINDEIDPTIYFRYITRDGGESEGSLE